MNPEMPKVYKWTPGRYFTKNELYQLKSTYQSQSTGGNVAYFLALTAATIATGGWFGVALGLVGGGVQFAISNSMNPLGTQLEAIMQSNNIHNGINLKFYGYTKTHYNPDGTILKQTFVISQLAIA